MATVIKRNQLIGSAAASTRAFHLADYEAEAKQILARARRQADAILADAAAQAARIEEEARRQGHREGVEQGREEGRLAGRDEAFRQAREEFERQRSDLAAALKTAMAAFDEQKSRFLLSARADVVALALEIARRVVKRIAATPAEAAAVAVENAAAALELVSPASDPVLRVNPADLQAMEAFAAELAASVRERRHVRVVADASVSPGGCLLETEEGRIDATLETQLDRIAELLLPGRQSVGERGS